MWVVMELVKGVFERGMMVVVMKLGLVFKVV